jgi:flagellar hook-associated protein 2
MTNSVSSLFSSSEITSLVSQLETRLDAPITVEQDQVKTDQAQISALGSVQGALSSLSSALSKISDPSSIDSMQATVSNSNATASAGASAVSGSYTLSNIVLAKPQELLSKPYTSGSAELGSSAGTVTFTFAGGTTATVDVASGSASISGIAKAINEADAGVSASVIQTGSGAYLSLQGGETGTSESFSVSGTGSLAGLSYSTGGSSSTLSLAQAARDAQFDLNGALVVESSNANLSVVQGLTINLTASGSANIKVAASTEDLSSALSSFATQFNNAVSVIAKETEYKAATSSSASTSGSSSAAEVGPLLGDITVEQLSQALLSTIASAGGSGVSAASIGLTLGSTGSLTFSSAALASAYAKNPTAVNNLVQKIEQGLSGVLAGALGSDGSAATAAGSGTTGSGAIGAATTDLKSTVTSLDQAISAQETLAAEQVASLEQAFSTAEANFNSASTTLDYLSAILGTSSGSGG